MSLYLRNVNYWDRLKGTLVAGDLVVEAGRIEPAASGPRSGQTEIGGHGGLALEGLTCGHHHIYSALARGMPAPPRTPRNFAEILELVWWRLDRNLDLDMIRASALAAGMDCLRCGVTRVIDHHASPLAVPGSLDAIAEAFDSLGLSHVLCYELSDRDGPESAAQGLAETDRYLSSGRPGMVGLHASFTVGDQLLADAVALARKHDTGIHIHVAEDEVDQERCVAEHGCRVVERLKHAGALDLPGTLVVHGLHLNDVERALVKASPAWVVQNTESNLNNAVGMFTHQGLDPDRIMIGTDGMHGDMLRSLKAAYIQGQTTGGETMPQAWNELWNNQRYLEEHHPLAAQSGDLVIFDYAPPTPLSSDNLLGHAFFGLDARHVRTVIAGGQVVVQDGRLTTIDEDSTLRFCREQADRLWLKLQQS